MRPLLANYTEIVEPELVALHAEYEARFGEPVRGLTRCVYLDPANRRVFKLPCNMAGIDQNFREAGHGDPELPVAHCDLLDWEAEFPVLEMEWVVPLERIDYDALPDWVGWVDCGQVGHNDAGQLVAFDL